MESNSNLSSWGQLSLRSGGGLLYRVLLLRRAWSSCRGPVPLCTGCALRSCSCLNPPYQIACSAKLCAACLRAPALFSAPISHWTLFWSAGGQASPQAAPYKQLKLDKPQRKRRKQVRLYFITLILFLFPQELLMHFTSSVSCPAPLQDSGLLLYLLFCRFGVLCLATGDRTSPSCLHVWLY